jgi:hypothetical protein
VDADGDCSNELVAVKYNHPCILDGLFPTCVELASKISVTFEY